MILIATFVLSAAPAGASMTTVQVGLGGLNFNAQNVTINKGDPVHWNWDSSFHSVTSGAQPPSENGFFDSQVQNPPHGFDEAFNAPGTYHYFCKVHYASGMVGTVTVTGGPDPQPSAAFTASTSTPAAGQAVSFNASGSSTHDGDTIDSYTWNFGDGTSPQTTSTPTTTHTFAKPGPVTVTLTITDAGSAVSAPASHALTVGPAAPSAGGRAVITKLKLSRKRFCTRHSARCRRPGIRISFRLSKASAVTLTLKRHGRVVRRRQISGKKGFNSLRFQGWGLRRGRYQLTLTPAGGKPLRVNVRVTGG
jgi:plastocyanin